MRIKRILIASLVLNLFFLAMTGLFTTKVMGFPVERAPLNYENRKSLLDVLPIHANDIVFLGDSLTQLGEWSELFSNPQIKNRGIAGDISEGVLQRLDGIVAHQPRKIFLMIGINDLGRNIEHQTIVNHYREILATIQERSPQTEVFIQSVLPINTSFNSNFYRFTLTDREVVALNRELRQLSAEFGLTYIDLFPQFTDSYSELKSEYTFDGLHLNGSGYLAWKSAIEQYVNEEDG